MARERGSPHPLQVRPYVALAIPRAHEEEGTWRPDAIVGRMDAEVALRIVEDLLAAEVEHLARYNRLLERGLDAGLAGALARWRDDEVARVDALQARVRSCRIATEVRSR